MLTLLHMLKDIGMIEIHLRFYLFADWSCYILEEHYTNHNTSSTVKKQVLSLLLVVNELG